MSRSTSSPTPEFTEEAAIRADERRKVLAEVLRGLASERQTTEVRAIIASVQWMRDQARPSREVRDDPA